MASVYMAGFAGDRPAVLVLYRKWLVIHSHSVGNFHKNPISSDPSGNLSVNGRKLDSIVKTFENIA